MTDELQAVSAEERMAGAGKTFYRAARLLPRGLRRDIVALYVFCRTVDDLADDPGQPVAERERALLAMAATLEAGDAEALREVGWPFKARGVLAGAAAMLVRAGLGDLRQVQPLTTEDLLGYAFGVAGTVGVMMAEVLHARPEGYGAAVALGMAMQLSNISRDVAEDLEAGRVYLPAAWVSVAAVRRAVEGGGEPEGGAVREATGRLLALADLLYAAAFDGVWTLPWRVRWSILAAGLCYREIGVAVGRDVTRSWGRRTVVSSGRKLWLIGVAGLRLFLPRYWRRGRTSWAPVLGSGALAAGRELGVVPEVEPRGLQGVLPGELQAVRL